MINSVRNTVMAVVNKNNFGYITPSDFNLYAKQAQLDIFEDYFYRYNTWVSKRNNRTAGTGYSDIAKNLEEVIDTFSIVGDLTLDAGSTFILPANYYLLNTVRHLGATEVERVSNNKALNLLSSNLTAPSTMYPCYVMNENKVTVYPDTIVADVSSQYIRVPLDPKWSYATLTGGEPLFDQSAADYQDFELPKTDEYAIVDRILQYVGVSLRDRELVQHAASQELTETQQEG